MFNLSKQEIIDVKVSNIIGKHTNDKVVLVGNYLYKDSSFVENVEIVIDPENGLPPIITKISYVGYNLELFLGDFNGDEKAEIMVRGEYGGAGGYAIAAIYEYKDGKLVEVFNPDMFSEKYKLIAKYLEGYKVIVESVTLKEKYIFDISKKPKIYLDMIYDENGKVKNDEEPIISAINQAFPIKLVLEKNYYLFIRQRVIGVSNADKIGYVESFVNLLNNDIKVVDMGAYQLGEKENINNFRMKISRGYNMRCEKHSVDTIKMFLPPMSKIVFKETTFKIPAVKLLREKDSTTYWYYLADAQIKTGDNKEACQYIDKVLAAEYSYLSIEELMRLKKQIGEYRPFSNQYGIDFSSIEYITSETEKDIYLEQALVKAFDLEEELGKVRYYYNKVDLNEDGNPEVFVYLVGQYVCGTGGCSAAIFNKRNKEYTLLSKFTIVNNPVIMSNTKTNGYRDIIMYVSGGGIESFFALIKYDGTTYPSNPSIQPKVIPGTELDGIGIVADDISENLGIELKRRSIFI